MAKAIAIYLYVTGVALVGFFAAAEAKKIGMTPREVVGTAIVWPAFPIFVAAYAAGIGVKKEARP